MWPIKQIGEAVDLDLLEIATTIQQNIQDLPIYQSQVAEGGYT